MRGYVEYCALYKENLYHVTAKFYASFDSNYGADADGNRGEPVSILEDMKLSVLDYNDDVVEDEEVIDYFTNYTWDNYVSTN